MRVKPLRASRLFFAPAWLIGACYLLFFNLVASGAQAATVSVLANYGPVFKKPARVSMMLHAALDALIDLLAVCHAHDLAHFGQSVVLQ